MTVDRVWFAGGFDARNGLFGDGETQRMVSSLGDAVS